MRNVTPEQVAMAEQHRRGELPDRIEGALGELAGAAKEGLMALSVGVGLGVLHELMAAEVDEVVGPNGAGKSTTIHVDRTCLRTRSCGRGVHTHHLPFRPGTEGLQPVEGFVRRES